MKNKFLPGNILDIEVQGCESGQTKGISVGPDTSLGIAELLLSVIDNKLAEDGAIIGGVRFIDDMEFGFKRLSDAERTLLRLEGMLNEFELQLNTTKTRIVELPDSLDSVYATGLRPHRPKDTGAHRWQWTDYFNQAFTQAKINPGDSVLRYAIASLRGVICTPGTWSLAQGLLWQSVTVDPGCLRFVLDVLIFNQQQAKHVIDKEMAVQAIGSLVETSAPAGHASEVLWSIWSAMILNTKLPAECQELIADMNDALVASAAFLAKDMGLFEKGFESPGWNTWIVDDCFKQEYWLFAYEALRRDWLPKKIKAAKIASVPAVKFLDEGHVSFLDDKAAKNYTPPNYCVHQSIATGY